MRALRSSDMPATVSPGGTVTIVRDPKSDLYIAICTACGTRVHIDSDSGFGAASRATNSGWVLGLRDLCRDCAPPDEPAPRPRRAHRAA